MRLRVGPNAMDRAVAFVARHTVRRYTGELGQAVAHSQEHPEVITITVISAVAGYVSTAMVLVLVRAELIPAAARDPKATRTLPTRWRRELAAADL